MDHRCSRRSFIGAAVGASMSGALLFARQPPAAGAQGIETPGEPPDSTGRKSVVSLISGENRRRTSASRW